MWHGSRPEEGHVGASSMAMAGAGGDGGVGCVVVEFVEVVEVGEREPELFNRKSMDMGTVADLALGPPFSVLLLLRLPSRGRGGRDASRVASSVRSSARGR